MSKSRLKPEDIFFGLQKTHENKNKTISETQAEADTVAANEPEAEKTEVIEQTPKKRVTATKAEKKPTPEKKAKAVSSDSGKRVAINVLVPQELKYTAVAVINEMKMQGLKDRYSITDFVIEAIEEKIKRTKKQLDQE